MSFNLLSFASETATRAVETVLIFEPESSESKKALRVVGEELAGRVIRGGLDPNQSIVVVCEAEDADGICYGFLRKLVEKKYTPRFVCLWAERTKLGDKFIAEVTQKYVPDLGERVDQLFVLQSADIRSPFIRTAIATISAIVEPKEITVLSAVTFPEPGKRLSNALGRAISSKLTVFGACELSDESRSAPKIIAMRDCPEKLVGLERSAYKAGFFPVLISAILRRPDLSLTPKPII